MAVRRRHGAAMADPADLQRLLGDLAREGTVVSVDHASGTCRVAIGALVTGDIPWLAHRAGETRLWSPPSIGEQVAVLAPEADTARAIVIGSLSSDANPAPAGDASIALVFGDGARLSYDPDAHRLEIALPAGATVRIDAESAHIAADVTIDGDVDVQGTITASADVVGAGKSLKGHKHTGVQTGGGISGAPQ